MAKKVAINGFGRIGRLALRNILERDDLEVVSINDLMDNEALAYLFGHDTVHGNFQGKVGFSDDALIIDGKSIPMTSHREPKDCKWGDLGIDVVLECTGVFLKREMAQLHIDAGAKRVLLSAPGKNADATFVLGVNHEDYDPDKHKIISNASCTTNCVAPPLKALHDQFKLTHGVLNTVHAYTMGQSLLDAPKKKLRRGRAAALNLVPTSTGAAKAVGVVLPELNGKLDGFAVRAPVPTGSMADLTLLFEKDPTIDEAHKALSEFAANHPSLVWFSKDELVSSDIVGLKYSSVVDSLMTLKVGPMLKLIIWYDNEAGYSARMVDMAAHIAR